MKDEPELSGIRPVTLNDLSAIALDSWTFFYREWLYALANDYWRFWLEPYFMRSTGKKPPGYYYRLARVKPR